MKVNIFAEPRGAASILIEGCGANNGLLNCQADFVRQPKTKNHSE